MGYMLNFLLRLLVASSFYFLYRTLLRDDSRRKILANFEELDLWRRILIMAAGSVYLAIIICAIWVQGDYSIEQRAAWTVVYTSIGPLLVLWGIARFWWKPPHI